MNSTATQRRSRLRLTRRGRVVFTAMAAFPIVIAAFAFALNGGALATAAHAQPLASAADASLQYVTVSPGQSLWQLAQSIAPDADPREVISDITRLNGLDGSTVHPGQRVAVPERYTR